MEQINAFKTNEHQAVQSKSAALSDEIKLTWNSWFDAQGVSGDFMKNRDQSIPQIRDSV